MERVPVTFTINGEEITHYTKVNQTLLKMLRDELDLTGAKEGCGAGECGACTILMNGKAVNACLVLAPEADGSEIVTIEGLAQKGKLDPIQVAFIEHAALQCGYCTPGMVMSAKALLLSNPTPTREEIIESIDGNLCRCTGYKKIIEAIESVVNENRG